MPYPYTLTVEAVRKLEPSGPDFKRVSKILPKRRKLDAAQARELGCTYDDIIWIASAVAMNDESLARRLTGYLNDNAKAVLHIFEERAPDDTRVRDCIAATDGFLNGAVSESDWQHAAWSAWYARAAWAARAARAAWAAWDAWDAWGARDAWDARGAWDARDARDAFEDWQFDRLICWLTTEHPEPLPMPDKGRPALPEIAKLEAAQ